MRCTYWCIHPPAHWGNVYWSPLGFKCLIVIYCYKTNIDHYPVLLIAFKQVIGGKITYLSRNHWNMFLIQKGITSIVACEHHIFDKWSPKLIFFWLLSFRTSTFWFSSFHLVNLSTYWSSTEIYAQSYRINRLICCEYRSLSMVLC